MADANATVGPPQGLLATLLERTTMIMLKASELKNNHYSLLEAEILKG